MAVFKGTIAVTGMNATDNPGPGVAVIRALRSDPRFQGRIVGLAYDALDPGLYLPGTADASFLIPYPSAGREALFARLAYIRETVGLDVLIPNLDSELPSLMGMEPQLEAMGIQTFLPTRKQYDARAKANLDSLREKYGIPVPASTPIVDVDGLYTLNAPFPMVIKGVFYGAEVVHSFDEAVKAFHAAAAKWGLPVIAQQFVTGEEVNVCAVGDGDGGLIGAVAMKKLLLTDKGKGWAGVTIRDPKLLELTADIVAALNWRGPCEIEVRRDDGGNYHLIEVNPRFPAWCDLCAGAGQNLILAVARLARGEMVEPMTEYRLGTAFIRVSIDQIVDISQLEAISTLGEQLPEAAKRSA